jgi:hypothetical protein
LLQSDRLSQANPEQFDLRTSDAVPADPQAG